MSDKKILILLCLFFAFFLIFSRVDANISRDLKQGDRGPDVKELQVRLNSDSRTRLASFGAGSPGSETEYFGPLTVAAAIRFQELHRSEVLAPIGLFSGTGYVGPMTRTKLNTLSSPTTNTNANTNTNININTVTETVPALPTETNIEPAVISTTAVATSPVIHYLSQYYAMPGTSVTIFGAGFTSNNKVHIGNAHITDDIPSNDGSTLTFVVPSGISIGDYNLWVANENGSSENASYGDFFRISNASFEAPEIYSVFPQKILRDSSETIVINGFGFDTTNNVVYTNMGMSEGLSSDGNSIRFRLSDLSGFASLPSGDAIKGQVIPISVQVSNRYGVSATPAYISLTL